MIIHFAGCVMKIYSAKFNKGVSFTVHIYLMALLSQWDHLLEKPSPFYIVFHQGLLLHICSCMQLSTWNRVIGMFIQCIMNCHVFIKFRGSVHNISTRTHLWSQSWVIWTHSTASHLIRSVLLLSSSSSNCHCLLWSVSFRYYNKNLICISHIIHALHSYSVL